MQGFSVVSTPRNYLVSFGNSAKFRDQFISNMPHMIKSTTVKTPVSTNDHCTIEVKLLFRLKKQTAYTRKMWNFKNANFDNYRQALSETNWDECFTDETNINNVANLWTFKVLAAAEASITCKNVTVRPNDKPWYNNYLRQLCRKKERLHKIAKHNNLELHWTRFITTRNFYFSEIKRLKMEYDKEKYKLLANENKSSKRWWSIINKVQKDNDSYEAIPPIETDNDILTSDKDKAEAFNAYISSASRIDDSNTHLPDILRVLDANNLMEIEITKQDVIDQLKALDVDKSYGPDGISPRFLKESGDILVNSIQRLLNLSWRLSKVPKLWKQANVVPIFKKGVHTNMSNYRPVSLLSTVGKLMESIVFKYVFNYFKDNFVI